MVLVSYADDSESESGPDISSPPVSKKRKRKDIEEPVEDPKSRSRLPPLPEKLHSLYASSTRTHPTDDPSLHDGRTRQVPHLEGNWPTHIYLEWYPLLEQVKVLQTIIDTANTKDEIHSLLRSELGAQLPLHISLSAPLVLRTEQKSGFSDALREAVKRECWGFETRIRGVRWERNFDESRWFLVLIIGPLGPFNRELNAMLASCNGIASKFDLPLLYERDKEAATMKPGIRPITCDECEHITTMSGTSPNTSPSTDPIPSWSDTTPNRTDAFHISIAWQLAAPAMKQKSVTADPIIQKLQHVTKALRFEVVKVKIGNTVEEIRLRAVAAGDQETQGDVAGSRPSES